MAMAHMVCVLKVRVKPGNRDALAILRLNMVMIYIVTAVQGLLQQLAHDIIMYCESDNGTRYVLHFPNQFLKKH